MYLKDLLVSIAFVSDILLGVIACVGTRSGYVNLCTK